VENDDLIVEGCGYLTGGEVDSFTDHRIVMSAAVAATICTGEVVINNAQDVAKSYPGFFEDYQELGGELTVICEVLK
jgi:3-phosphoshikimate 1-carboxyvinyltransferase